MKSIFILFFLAVTIKLFPQQINQPVFNNSSQNDVHQDKIGKCHKMKKNGIVMICAGSAGFIGGVVLFVSGLSDNIKKPNQSFNNNTPQQNGTNNLPKMYAGSILSTIGLLAITAGTSLYIVGKRREKKWKSTVSISVSPASFRIAYKF
jgi:uncharacterized membrane protein